MREVFEGVMSLKEHKGIFNRILVLETKSAIEQFVNNANIITKCHTVENSTSFRLIGKSLKKMRKMKFHYFCSSLCLRTSLSC